MEWQSDVKELYDKMVLRVPEMIRPIIGPALFQGAEKKCLDRMGKNVAEVDFVTALFEVTPAGFQPTMIGDLKALGIDADKYLAKVKGAFKLHNDLNKMIDDIMKLCKITGIKGNKEAVWKVIKAYEPFFAGSPVSIRSTTKPVEKRDVSIRYVELMMPHNPDPYTTAIKNGLLKKENHPLHKMYQETLEKIDILGYGVDIDTRIGLSKIWAFTVPWSIDPVFSMKYIPKSFINFREHFEKHGLSIFSVFAFDFSNKTMNIYFMLRNPATATREKCERIVKECGFEIASKEIMEKCANAAHLSYTFSWDSDKVERVCFGIVCNHFKDVPVHFHPVMKEFVEKTPLQVEKLKFIYSITFTPKGLYYKIENDYNGTMADFLLLGAKAGLESYN